MLMLLLATAGESDDVAQELQMPLGPQALADAEETMPSRPATLNDPGIIDQILLDQRSLTNFPSHPKDVRRISIENSRKLTQCRINLSLTTATSETEAFYILHVSSLEQTPILEPYTRQWCQTTRRLTCSMWMQEQLNVRDWSTNACVYTEITKEFFICYRTEVANTCRLEGQDWQILQQVSPTQIHESSGAAEKAVSSVMFAHIWQSSKTKTRLSM